MVSIGIDVEDVKFVIDYDYPNSSEDYIHWIGRTACSTKTGTEYPSFTPNNIKQVSYLIYVLWEVNQAINPKLLQLGENRGSGIPGIEEAPGWSSWQILWGQKSEFNTFREREIMTEATPVCLREIWRLMLNGVYSAAIAPMGVLDVILYVLVYRPVLGQIIQQGFTRTVIITLSNMQVTLQICKIICTSRQMQILLLQLLCLWPAIQSQQCILNKILEESICTYLFFIIVLYVMSSEKIVI